MDLEKCFDDALNRMKTSAEELLFKEKQKLIKLLVEKVIVGPNKVKIIHCISPHELKEDFCQSNANGLARNR